MKRISMLLLLFLVFVQGQTIPQYYNNIDFRQPKNIVKNQIAYLISTTHQEKGYNVVWSILDKADEDPDNPENVLLIYGYNNINGSRQERSRNKLKKDSIAGSNTDKWNREHVFPKSLGNPVLIGTGNVVDAGSDAHNLRAADVNWNSTRNNRIFEDAQGFSRILQSGNWYPGDEWKGDVARIIMYMYVRYGTRTLPNSLGAGGNTLYQIPDMPDVFLKWNIEDPPSAFEIRRNNEIWKVQENRNPFIDNPYIATIIWGGSPAQDPWNLTSLLNTADFDLQLIETDIAPSMVEPAGKVNITKPVSFIEIYSMVGTLIYRHIGKTKEFSAPKTSGIYLVKMLSEENNKPITKKLIVK